MPKLSEEKALDLVKKYGIKIPKHAVAKNEVQLKAAVRRVGFPLVMKLVSQDVLHKSDVGGVVLGIKNEHEALNALQKFRGICAKRKFRFGGALVQQFIEGKYVIVGFKRDPTFGPVVLFGLGGIFVEVMKDVSFRVWPFTSDDVRSMIREIKGYPILAGTRGEKAVDMKSIEAAITAVAKMGIREKIEEMDVNPLVVSSHGAWAVDVRIVK